MSLNFLVKRTTNPQQGQPVENAAGQISGSAMRNIAAWSHWCGVHGAGHSMDSCSLPADRERCHSVFQNDV